MLLRTRGDTSGVDRFKRSLSSLGLAVGAISFVGVARSAVDAADSVTLLESKLRLVTTGAEDLAKVQSEIINLSRQTRTDFGSVGELYARIARSSKQLGVEQSDVLRVTKAVSQAIQISGNTATEATAGMIQLAQALASGTLRGDELRSVLEQMPRVAEAIATGLGTTIGQLRKLGEQGKLTSDLVFKALISQASQLDSEFKKLTPTISGSFSVLLADLKLATADLLKVSGVTEGLTKSINLLSESVRGLTSLLKLAADATDALGASTKKTDKIILDFLGISEEQFNRFEKHGRNVLSMGPIVASFLALADRPERKTRGPTGAQRGRGRQGDASLLPPVVDIDEFRVTVQSIRDEYGGVLRDLEESTRTSVERQSAEYIKLRTTLEFLRDERLITPEVFAKRRDAALDELLPEFDLNEIRAKYKVVKKETTELGEFMKGVWQGVGRSIQSTLSDALYEWNLSWKSLIDIARRALADITSAIITSGIKNALKNATSGSSGGSGGNWLSAIGSFFGFAAGGGRTDGPTIVGEDGPELVMGTKRVMNQRQMAFSGSGGAVTYSPTFNVAIVEREDPEQTKREVYQTVSVMLSQDKAEFVRTLDRSGYQVRG